MNAEVGSGEQWWTAGSKKVESGSESDKCEVRTAKWKWNPGNVKVESDIISGSGKREVKVECSKHKFNIQCEKCNLEIKKWKVKAGNES